jgi:putative addiction module killer protein
VLELVNYKTLEGREPFQRWFGDLDVHAAAKVTTALKRIAAGSFSEVKPVGSGVLERRIYWGPGYRVYFGRDGSRLVILLAGGTKQRQQQNIAVARARWADFKRRRDS